MFDFTYLILSFAGGVWGAAIGGLPAFVMCGIVAVVGLGINLVTGDPTFVNEIAWGPFFGPHIAFVGGVAAAAYAGKVGKLESGKDIITSLMGLNAPDVLLVGGVFGALGYLLNWLFTLGPHIGDWLFTMSVPLAIVGGGIITRLVFGKTGVFGKVREGDSRWVRTDVAMWLPWQEKPLMLLLIGIGVGLPVARIIQVMPALFTFGFAVTAISLVFLGTGSKFPVSHHIGVLSGMGVIVTGDIWWGVTFGVLGAFLAEWGACLLHNHGDTHIDPPSIAVCIGWTLLAILSTTGLKDLTGIASFIVAVVVSAVLYFLTTFMKRSGEKAAAYVAEV